MYQIYIEHLFAQGYENEIGLQNIFDTKVPSLRCQAFNSLFSSFRLGLCGQRNQGFFRLPETAWIGSILPSSLVTN